MPRFYCVSSLVEMRQTVSQFRSVQEYLDAQKWLLTKTLWYTGCHSNTANLGARPNMAMNVNPPDVESLFGTKISSVSVDWSRHHPGPKFHPQSDQIEICAILHTTGWLKPYKYWDVHHQLQDFATTVVHRSSLPWGPLLRALDSSAMAWHIRPPKVTCRLMKNIHTF